MFVPPIDMQASFPSLQMRNTLPRMTIDAEKAHSDIGLKPIGPLMREQAAKEQAAGLEAISQIAQEGDRLARVEVSANGVAEIAAEKWPKLRELNVDAQPEHRPVIDIEEGVVNLRLVAGEVRVEVPHLTRMGTHVDLQA